MRDTPRTTGTVPERVRRIPDDPATEVVVSVARFEIKDDNAYNAYSAAGHCGKPASGKCLYCSNHYAAHENDPTTRIVRQAVDNRGANGNKGRQNVILCAHVDATPKPSNIVTPTAPATHTPTMNARTEKEITMSTTNNNTTTNVNLDAITAQIAALNAALAALNAPATTTPATSAPANVTTTPANVTTTPANVTTTPANVTSAPAVIIEFSGALSGAMTANAANATTGNTGWRGQCKVVGVDGQKYQVSFQAWRVGGNPAKPPTTKTAKK